MRTYKNSGIEWIGEIPVEWEVGKTKHHFLNHKFVVGEKSDEYERLALTLNGVIKRAKDDSTGLQPEAFEGYQIVYPNELIFKLIDLANVSTSRVGLSIYTGIVSPAYIILKAKDNYSPRYAEYYFLSMWQREVFNHMGDDGVRSSLNATYLLNIPLLSLSTDEQSKIADFLDYKCGEIDTVIAKTKATIEEYKKLKQSIITDAVTKGIRGERPMKDCEYEWIGTLPVDWDVIKIKWLLSERNERSENGDEEPLSMSQKYGLIPTKEMDMIPNMASSFVGAKLAYVGDLVFNKLKAHLGVFAVSLYDGLVSPDYAVYYSTGKANLKYLEYLFKTPQYIAEFRKKSSGVGAGLTRLYTGDLYSIYCGLPSLAEQEEIANYIDQKCSEMDALIQAKEQVVAELENYKKSVIQKYI